MQAQRRVSANSLGKMARKVLAAVPGLKPPGSGRFYYPRQGYGQISNAYYQAAQRAGAKFHFNAMLHSVEITQNNVLNVCYKLNGEHHSLGANYVWSTIPITALARCIKPSPPSECLDAVENIDYRAMILIYLVLEQDHFSEYDAHYFPETYIPISRMSEPKNYSASLEPRNRTVLCAELPCSPEDPVWKMTDEELGKLVCDALASADIPVQAPVSQIATRRLRQAYPIYRRGYEASFNLLDAWLTQFDGLLTFGRQGLFAHDNTHHALFMAYSAANCLTESGDFDRQKWRGYRRVFETHVVED
jgi:protoporphyrinogen oxidase